MIQRIMKLIHETTLQYFQAGRSAMSQSRLVCQLMAINDLTILYSSASYLRTYEMIPY